MKTLRSAYFYPLTGSIALNVTEGSFRRTDHLSIADLPEEMRQIAEGAMAWLSAQLPEGMQTLVQVILERNADIPTAWSEGEEPQPTAFSPSFSISATGQGPAGEDTIRVQSEAGELTNATAALWDYLVNL